MANSLLTDRRFWPLFWTQFFGALNDNFFKNALVIMITYKIISLSNLDAALLIPAAGGIFIFPFFIFSATAGQMADKFQKAKMIRVTKVTEILVMGLATTGFFMDNVVLLMTVLFLMGTQSAFFGPLKYGIIPSLMKPSELTGATAFVSAGTFVAILGGTIFGGVIAQTAGFALYLSIGVLSLGVCGLISSLFIQEVPVFEKETKVDYTFFKPTWDILIHTTRNKNVFRTVLGISWFWFVGAAILSILPVLAKDVLGANGNVATIFLAIFVIGMVLGSIITKMVSSERVEMGIVPLSLLGMSVFLVDMYWVGSTWPALSADHTLYTAKQFFEMSGSIHVMFALLMVSTFGGCYIVPQMTYIQEISDKSEVSRTIAGNNIWNALFMVTAAIVVMVLNKTVGTSNGILIIAGVNFFASILLYKWHSVKTVRFWGWMISHTLYKVEITGAENLPKDGACIVASNHVSFIDWVLVYAAVPRPIQFVIDWNYYYLPGAPFWLRQAKLVPIATKRESEEVLTKAFEQITEHIEDGAMLGIFPEGWITRDGNMRPFQPGICKIIKKDPVPIVLCAVEGLWGSIFSWEGGKLIFKFPKSIRKKVKITFSTVIQPEDYSSKKAEEFMRDHVGHYIETPTEKKEREENK